MWNINWEYVPEINIAAHAKAFFNKLACRSEDTRGRLRKVEVQTAVNVYWHRPKGQQGLKNLACRTFIFFIQSDSHIYISSWNSR